MVISLERWSLTEWSIRNANCANKVNDIVVLVLTPFRSIVVFCNTKALYKRILFGVMPFLDHDVMWEYPIFIVIHSIRVRSLEKKVMIQKRSQRIGVAPQWWLVIRWSVTLANVDSTCSYYDRQSVDEDTVVLLLSTSCRPGRPSLCWRRSWLTFGGLAILDGRCHDVEQEDISLVAVVVLPANWY
jgi:hypothetical protein